MLGLFVLWSLLPLGILFVESHRGVFNGSDGLQVADHLQYLAWVRDAGENVLFSNRFDVVADPHLFLHPVVSLSGLAWSLGASVQLANLLWKPVAVLVLFAGFAAFVRRLVPPGAERTVALGLALFFVTPATPLFEWLAIGDDSLEFSNLVMALEMFPGGYVWGGYAGSISVGLMPVFLICLEGLLEPHRRRPGRSSTWYAVTAGVAGLLVSWLHPWQGATLILMAGGLVAWCRFDRGTIRAVTGPLTLTAIPLVYYFALSHTDSSWGYVSQPNDHPHFGWWLLLGLAPFALALAGVRKPGRDVGERLLILWVPAALVLYFGMGQSWFYHALIGLSLPLAVFLVRSAARLRRRRAVVGLGVAALTLPGLALTAQQFTQNVEGHYLTPDERAALGHLDAAGGDDPVLARLELGQAVPAFSGRRTYVGHYTWTPDYEVRVARAGDLFGGRLSPGEGRQLVDDARARFLLAGCDDRADMRPTLGDRLVSVRRFGCVTVYELRRPVSG